MNIGTKSVLFGAHQFLLHPLFVAVAWWKLYGFPWDPRLWVAFFVHDLGYWGKPNMDGTEGEMHPILGAKIMGWLFDRAPADVVAHAAELLCIEAQCLLEGHTVNGEWDGTDLDAEAIYEDLVETANELHELSYWHDFTLYHSRFAAKRDGNLFSFLCVADKLSCALEPDWLYLIRVIATGEIREYMEAAAHKEGAKYKGMGMDLKNGVWAWRRSIKDYLTRWAYEHADGREDTWTPERAESEAEA